MKKSKIYIILFLIVESLEEISLEKLAKSKRFSKFKQPFENFQKIKKMHANSNTEKSTSIKYS